jgi:4-amino-4-deoxy-L-arabinose transferase-like glycosyltransferase
MMTYRAALTWLILLLLGASALRFVHLDQQSIWFDEGWSAYAAEQPGPLAAARADLTNPPLYYMLLNGAATLIGTSEFALRWVSTALNLLNIALIYHLARRLSGRRAGVYATLLATCSALMWWASQEARMYTLLALLVTLCALAWQRLLRAPSRGAWLLLWASELALLYAHNTGPIAALWINIVTVLAWLASRSLRRPDWHLWLTGQLGVFVLWLPWLNIFLDVREANAAIASAPVLTPDFLLNLWEGFLVGVWSLVDQRADFIVAAVGLLLLSMVLIRWRDAASRWLVIHCFVLVGGIVAGLMLLENEYHGRYAVLAIPLLWAALGAGIARLRQPALRAGAALPFIALFCGVYIAAQDPSYQHDDVRGMVRHYAETLTADDSVIAWSYADRYDLRYYWERLSVRAARITLPEGADIDTILPLLPADGAASINIWYTQRADYRGMLPCLLAHRTALLPREFTTYGMTDIRFDQHSPEIPVMLPARIPFAQERVLIAAVEGHGALPPASADEALCIPVQLRLLHPLDTALKAAVIVRNPLGWEIARADAIFATAEQRTTDMPGVSQVAAYPLLRLPFGAPEGAYDIYLRLYDDTRALSGYEPADSTLPTSGRDVLLGTWRAQPSPDWESTGRSTALPTRHDLVLSPDLRLVASDLHGEQETLRNGDRLRLSLLWEGSAPPPTLRLRAVNGDWEIDIPPSTIELPGSLLDWREAQIPLSAGSGDAQLLLPDGTPLAHYTIESTPLLTEPPAMMVQTEAHFVGLGMLAGYTVEPAEISLGAPVEITLLWRAEQTPLLDYTVFVQILADDNRIIAQSDAMPALGQRATSGWRPGEFILDQHLLRFSETTMPVSARLIVGLYDAGSNRRLLLEDGSDAVMLQTLDILP